METVIMNHDLALIIESIIKMHTVHHLKSFITLVFIL